MTPYVAKPLTSGAKAWERKLPLWPVEKADNTGLQTLPMLKAAESGCDVLNGAATQLLYDCWSRM
jgi:hypothetical protein